jgi:DNA topoisomerase VI subunit A
VSSTLQLSSNAAYETQRLDTSYVGLFSRLQENQRAELTRMVQAGKRAEIEALYSHGFDFLGKYIARKIVQGDYI